MSRKDKIAAELLREQAAEASRVAKQLAEAGKAARHLAGHGRDWATPRVDAAREWAAPRVDKAWRSGVQAAAPKVADYAQRSKGAVDVAHDRIVDDLIPKVIAAMEDAARAAKGGADELQDKAHGVLAAAEKAVAQQQKEAKSGSALGKTLGWVLVGGAVAGAGVLIWRRTQPVDDPWAEEYWDDAVAPGASDSTTSDAAPRTTDPTASLAFGSQPADADSAVDKAKHVADEARDALSADTQDPGEDLSGTSTDGDTKG